MTNNQALCVTYGGTDRMGNGSETSGDGYSVERWEEAKANGEI